jgi:hypothetical protein
MRIVDRLPLTSLWNSDGPLDAKRLHNVGAEQILQILETTPYNTPPRFIVASCGSPLDWISNQQTFSFWKTEVKPNLVDSEILDFSLSDFPREYAYCAVLWRLTTGEQIIVLEKHH